MKPIIKKNIKRSIAYSALALTFVQPITQMTTVFASPAEAHEAALAEVKSIQELLEEQELNIEEITKQLKDKEEELLILLSDIEEKENDISKLSKEIKTKNKEVKKFESLITEAEKELDIQIRSYEGSVEVAKNRAQSLQLKETNSIFVYMDVIMESENLADIIGKIHAVNTLQTAHNDLIGRIEEQAKSIESLKDELENNKEQLVKEQMDLNTLQEERNIERDVIITQKEAAESTIDELDAERKMLEEAYEGNLEALYAAEESAKGQELYESLITNEEEITLEDDIVMPSSSTEPINVLSRMTGGLRDPEIVKNVLDEANKHFNTPYVWGGMTPDGFDCSGLVQYAFKKAGINMPRTSREQANVGKEIPISKAQPGDLLFWEKGGQVYHVAIYIGNGEYIHAPRPGKTVGVANVKQFTPTSARKVIPNVEVEVEASLPTPLSVLEQSAEGITSEFQATAYAIGDGLTPSTVTANGTDVSNTITSPEGHRIIAADTSVLPMNSIVLVELPNGEKFTAKVSDTGSAIKGYKIDILTSSIQEARNFGRQNGIKIQRVN